MSGEARARVLFLVALLLGAVLLLSCQPAQPVATPKAGETPAQKAAATAAPTKAPEKAAEKPVKGGTLRISFYADPLSLDGPAVTAQPPANSMFDLLVQPAKDGNPTKEGLAKDWTIGGDGKVITFKLQEGVKFHDGTDFDAAAVKFNIERMKDPAFKSPYLSNYLAVTSVEVVDKATVRFNLSQPDPLLIIRLSTQGGMMASPTAVQRLGQDFGRKPVGSGPFQFVEWVPSDHITAKRFEGYWRKDQDGNQLPYLDQVVFKIITDQSVGFANLRTGQVEVYNPSASDVLPREQLPVLKADANLTYIPRPGTGISHIRLQTKKTPFDNKVLRQAVALATDREGMAVYFGELAKPWTSVFAPINWGLDPVKGVFPARDLAKAKAKMAEAGYPGGGGLKVKILSGNTTDGIKISEILQANLKEIGIESDIEALASSALLEKRDLQLDFQIAPGGTPIQLPDPGHVWGLMLHSKGTRNYFAYGNPQVDQLLDKAGSIYDQKERAALYQQAAQIIADDAPFVPTHSVGGMTPMSKKVQGYPSTAPPTTIGFTETWLAR